MPAEFSSPAPAVAAASMGVVADGPTQPVSRGWTAVYSLVWFGYWMANLAIGVIAVALCGRLLRR